MTSSISPRSCRVKMVEFTSVSRPILRDLIRHHRLLVLRDGAQRAHVFRLHQVVQVIAALLGDVEVDALPGTIADAGA